LVINTPQERVKLSLSFEKIGKGLKKIARRSRTIRRSRSNLLGNARYLFGYLIKSVLDSKKSAKGQKYSAGRPNFHTGIPNTCYKV